MSRTRYKKRALRNPSTYRVGWAVAIFLVTMSVFLTAQINAATTRSESRPTVAHLQDFPVVELRRYTIKQGEREHFALYFDTYFPEAIEQAGSIVFGEFLERKDSSGFTWIRGFHSMDDRAISDAMFYFGPVWKEYKTTMKDLLTDTDNVLLLRPLTREQGIPVLPMVDPVTEPSGAQGVVIAQIFAVKPDSTETFLQRAKPTFNRYQSAGVREAGILVTLDVPNNFPQLSVRTDGPYLVWLCILKDDEALKRFSPLTIQGAQSLSATGLLRKDPELVILDPTRRSRLRWVSDGR